MVSSSSSPTVPTISGNFISGKPSNKLNFRAPIADKDLCLYKNRPWWDHLNDPPLTRFNRGSETIDRSGDADVIYRERLAELKRFRAAVVAAEQKEVANPELGAESIQEAFARVDSADIDAASAFNSLLVSLQNSDLALVPVADYLPSSLDRDYLQSMALNSEDTYDRVKASRALIFALMTSPESQLGESFRKTRVFQQALTNLKGRLVDEDVRTPNGNLTSLIELLKTRDITPNQALNILVPQVDFLMRLKDYTPSEADAKQLRAFVKSEKMATTDLKQNSGILLTVFELIAAAKPPLGIFFANDRALATLIKALSSVEKKVEPSSKARVKQQPLAPAATKRAKVVQLPALQSPEEFAKTRGYLNLDASSPRRQEKAIEREDPEIQALKEAVHVARFKAAVGIDQVRDIYYEVTGQRISYDEARELIGQHDLKIGEKFKVREGNAAPRRGRRSSATKLVEKLEESDNNTLKDLFFASCKIERKALAYNALLLLNNDLGLKLPNPSQGYAEMRALFDQLPDYTQAWKDKYGEEPSVSDVSVILMELTGQALSHEYVAEILREKDLTVKLTAKPVIQRYVDIGEQGLDAVLRSDS